MRDVVYMDDIFGHEHGPECKCEPDAIVTKDGDMVYLHRNMSERFQGTQERITETIKDPTLETQRDYLVNYHNRLLEKVLETPKDFDAEVIRHLVNGVLIRLELLERKLSK